MPSPTAATLLALAQFLRPSSRRRAKDAKAAKSSKTKPSPPAPSSDAKPSKSSKLKRRNSPFSTPPDEKQQASLFKRAASSTPPPLHIQGISVQSPQLVTLHVNGNIVSSKSVQSPLQPPPGFVLGGDVELFGTGVPGKLFKVFGESKASGVRELVHLSRDVHLKELLRGVSGSKFGDICLGRVRFSYHAQTANAQPPGVYLSSEVPLDGPLGPVNDALINVFGIQQSHIALEGYVATLPDWRKPLRPKEFSLKAQLDGKAEKSGLVFTEMGVEMKAERKPLTGSLRGGYNFEVGFFGKVAVKLPGSVVPMLMQYTLKEEKSGLWVLRIVKADDWIDVVGFKGLKLSNVKLVASFPVDKSVDSFSFDVESTLPFGQSSLILEGKFNSDGFSLQASISKCTLSDIRGLYTSTTGRQLEQFQHPTVLEKMVLKIDKSGLSLSGKIEIHGHKAVSPSIEIRRDGISISGALEDVHLGELAIKSASLSMFIGRAVKNTTSRESGFSIQGNLNFHKIDIEVAAYMTYSKAEGLQWTVYGEIEGSGMKLSRLAPEVEGRWLDLQLSKVAFIASNTESPDGKYNVFAYPIKKGTQFCATIDHVQQVDHVVGSKVSGLILHAVWDGSFRFGILLPAPVGMSLGKNITSGPVELSIDVKKLELMFSASLNVLPHRQAQPLVFTFGLTGSLTKATGFGEMKNYWVSPFGIGENIKVGPNMAIQLGFDYAVVAATGAPSSVGLSGGMAIGDADAQMAMVVSANPLDEMIKASLSELSVTDLVKFASKVSGKDIPQPSREIMAFRDVLFYISSGVSIGTTTYAAGVSMKGEIELLGHKANLEAVVGSTTKISAAFDELKLGPLRISGAEGKCAMSVVELGLTKQHILVDGAAKLGSFLETEVHGTLDILPKPNLQFAMKYDFVDALDIELQAAVIGMVDWKNLHDADFAVHAILEQDILHYIIKQIKIFINAVIHLLQKGIEAAHEFLDAAHEEIDAAIGVAAAALEEAKASWHEKEDSVKKALKDAKQEFEEGVQTLEETFHQAKEEFEELIWHTHKEIEQTKLDHAVAEKEQDETARAVRRNTGKEIEKQLEEVRAVKQEMKTGFGDARKHILEATEGVAKAQAYYDECSYAYDSVEKQLDAAPFYRKIDLQIHLEYHHRNLIAAETDLAGAQHLLDQARAAASHEEYQALLQMKAEKKQGLLQKRGEMEQTLVSVEKDLVAKKKANEAVVQYKQSKLAMMRQVAENDVEHPTANLPQSTKVVAIRRELESFKAAKMPHLERAQEAHATLTSTTEYANLLAAQQQLRQAKKTSIDKDAAKHVVATLHAEPSVQTLSDADKTHHAGFLKKLENAIDIERIELSGSLRQLIEHGHPLDAKVRGVLVGKKFDVQIGYGVGDAKAFLKALWGVVWDSVKKEFEDGSSSDSNDKGTAT